jgi:hypothetical protein
MPCYDARDSQDNEENKRRLDLTTRLLCTAVAELQRIGRLEDPELIEWAKAHAAMDEKRLRAEVEEHEDWCKEYEEAVAIAKEELEVVERELARRRSQDPRRK